LSKDLALFAVNKKNENRKNNNISRIKKVGYISRSIKDELRDNLRAKIKSGMFPFPSQRSASMPLSIKIN
jgi:hypothetical protein